MQWHTKSPRLSSVTLVHPTHVAALLETIYVSHYRVGTWSTSCQILVKLSKGNTPIGVIKPKSVGFKWPLAAQICNIFHMKQDRAKVTMKRL